MSSIWWGIVFQFNCRKITFHFIHFVAFCYHIIVFLTQLQAQSWTLVWIHWMNILVVRGEDCKSSCEPGQLQLLFLLLLFDAVSTSNNWSKSPNNPKRCSVWSGQTQVLLVGKMLVLCSRLPSKAHFTLLTHKLIKEIKTHVAYLHIWAMKPMHVTISLPRCGKGSKKWVASVESLLLHIFRHSQMKWLKANIAFCLQGSL